MKLFISQDNSKIGIYKNKPNQYKWQRFKYNNIAISCWYWYRGSLLYLAVIYILKLLQFNWVKQIVHNNNLIIDIYPKIIRENGVGRKALPTLHQFLYSLVPCGANYRSRSMCSWFVVMVFLLLYSRFVVPGNSRVILAINHYFELWLGDANFLLLVRIVLFVIS